MHAVFPWWLACCCRRCGEAGGGKMKAAARRRALLVITRSAHSTLLTGELNSPGLALFASPPDRPCRLKPARPCHAARQQQLTIMKGKSRRSSAAAALPPPAAAAAPQPLLLPYLHLPSSPAVVAALQPDASAREIGRLAVWSVTTAKPGNGVELLRDGREDTYWQSDGAQPHLVNVQFQKKVGGAHPPCCVQVPALFNAHPGVQAAACTSSHLAAKVQGALCS